MPTNFEALTLERQQEYLQRLAATPEMASDYSFCNVYGWGEHYGLTWAFGDSHVWLQQADGVFWAPMGPWNDVEWAQCPSLAQGGRFIRVPETLARLWEKSLGERVVVEEAREHWDYLYSVPELIGLKGNKYHKKKNHLNQFKKKYDFFYREMGPECVEAALDMQEQWCQWRECEDSPPLVAENDAIYRILQQWDNIPGLMGGSLYVDDKLIAYTVAEELDRDNVVIHFEKAKPDFRGVYQAINQQFLENTAGRYQLVNREQDLGDEGLRKAKLSYQPVDFVKKYSVTIKPS